MASVFWDTQGIFVHRFLGKGRTTNRRYYIVLVHSKKEIVKKMATNEEEKVLFHQDNILCHKSIATMTKLHEKHFELLQTHPILQIWPLVTTGSLQTSKECFRERDLAPIKKLYQKLMHILRPKTNHST